MKLSLSLCCVAMLVGMVISSAQSNKNPSFTRGFAGNVEAGVLFNEGFAGEYVNVSSGYNVLPGLFAGVGIGIKNQRFNTPLNVKSVLVPTFIQLRYSFLNKSVSPFIDLKGGLISDYSPSLKDMPEGFRQSGCGHFFRVGVGVDYKRYSIYVGDDWSQISYSDSALNNYAWTFGIGYRF